MQLPLITLPNCGLFFHVFDSAGSCLLCGNIISSGHFGISIAPHIPIAGVTHQNLTFCYNCAVVVTTSAATMEEAHFAFCFFLTKKIAINEKKQKLTQKTQIKTHTKSHHISMVFTNTHSALTTEVIHVVTEQLRSLGKKCILVFLFFNEIKTRKQKQYRH